LLFHCVRKNIIAAAMKSLTFLLLASAAAAGTLQPRQHQHGPPTPKSGSDGPSFAKGFEGLFPSDPKKLQEMIAGISKLMSSMVKPAKVASRTTLTPKIRQDAIRQEIRFGPYRLEQDVR
jgi:hypothetical protein